MKNKKSLNKFAVGLLASLLIFNTSCSSTKKEVKDFRQVIPQQSQSHYDGNVKNGGIIEFSKEKGFKLTPNAAKRYVELTKLYGEDNLPKLSIGEGLDYREDGIYLSNEYMVEFMTMNEKYRILIK